MKKTYTFILLLFISLMLVGCGGHRPSITLRVLDEQTKEPIEGAYGIAWWYDVHGLPGLTHHELGELVEMVSDKEGNLKIPPLSCKTKPHIKVFKPGYVGWYNFEIYKGYYGNDRTWARVIKGKGFEYISQDIYLERWKNEYSHDSHFSFLNNMIPTGIGYNLQFSEAMQNYLLPFMK
ncbi:MAG: hypothetical protein OEV64_14460 [Desulfobulbaceae bacterium]|nr:hypothetical protein [Desulfobulbaceae bacterium]